ncbi:hypothetical protein [Paenibacillus alvei]|uniref:hypothetical protein n=1 Tax=Paenibacillus alvei TaxID=44250 RepID=UPI0013D921A4|nr:hypothetical protein [Paenibacillus alvei]
MSVKALGGTAEGRKGSFDDRIESYGTTLGSGTYRLQLSPPEGIAIRRKALSPFKGGVSFFL